jgi:acetylornithine deacetylase/succinyl-diaminopimelate desuccinylase-like protein
MSRPLRYVDEHLERFITELEAFLRIPSISTDGAHTEDVREAAQWLVDELGRIGVSDVRLVETPGHPIVLARHGDDPEKPTVLCYGHYDVQPPDPVEQWLTPPFEPTRRNGSLYARGAADDKGQLMMHVKALESFLQTGAELPVNVKFIWEGEEEVGSEHLGPFISDHKDWLSADTVLVSDTALFDHDVPSITCGLRGMAYVEVRVTGPSRDLHSGVYGGAVDNPINVLSRLIADLHDDDHRVAIEGFYDEVLELTEQDRAYIRSLPHDTEAWLGEIGVRHPRTEKGYSVLESTTIRPALDVNGIWGGYQGEGAKTVLPSVAGAKISMRLVPNQETDKVVELITSHLKSKAPETVNLDVRKLHGGAAIRIDPSSPAMNAAAGAMEEVFGVKPVFTHEGGSIPVVADFKQILGLDTILMGFGLNSDAIHSPNERFGLDRFEKGIRSTILFFERFGGTR